MTKKVTAEGGAILGSEVVTDAVPRACDVPPVAIFFVLFLHFFWAPEAVTDTVRQPVAI